MSDQPEHHGILERITHPHRAHSDRPEHEQPPKPVEPPPTPGDVPGGSPPRQGDPPKSPSRTPGEQKGDAPEDHRSNPFQLAQEHGRDPLPNKHDETGGAPGGSPGRPWDDPNAKHDAGTTQGACAPEPNDAKNHRPGEFEQPMRQEYARREYGDWAG